MAFALTREARLAAKQTGVEPTLVLEIDGVSTLYGIGRIRKYIRIGDPDLFIGNDWKIGGFNEVEDQLDIVSWDGSSSTISQQLLQDKGGTSSVSSIQIALIDEDNEATRLITPGAVVEDLLGKGARVYLGFSNVPWPEAYIQIFRGIIDDIDSDSKVILNIASPEQKKRQEILQKVQTETTGAINASQTTIPILSTVALALPADSGTLRCYVRIDDEVIEYTGVTTSTITGCTRGSLGTIAATHDDEASVDSIYRLTGNPIDLALKIQCSGLNGDYISDLTVKHIVYVDPTLSVPNAIVFDFDIGTKYGVTIGDTVTISGSLVGGNNVSGLVEQVVTLDGGGSYLVINQPLTLESDSPAVISIRSQFDVLGVGASMGADEVDVAEFKRIKAFATSSIPDMDFYLKDTIQIKEFIDTELLFPCAMYSLPRKGRASLGYTSPPLAISQLPVLDKTQVTNPQKTKIRRSLGKNFYNAVVYRYEEDILEDKFVAGRVTVSGPSVNRIKVGVRPLKITSKGLRDNGTTTAVLDNNARRLLDRYRFGAEMVKVQTQYGVGFNTEPGDIVLYGDEELLLPDVKNGTRKFAQRLMEVTNKSMNIKTGEISFELVDTNFSTGGRYGIVSPSSILRAGSTNGLLELAPSFGFEGSERDKWNLFINELVIIHDQAWDTIYETRFRGFQPGNPFQMIIDPVAAPPTANMVVELIPYPTDTNPKINRLSKAVFVYTNPTVNVVSAPAADQVEVSALDVGKFFVGSIVLIRDAAWDDISDELSVIDISGNIVTLSGAPAFTVTSAYQIDLIGYADKGDPYRYI